MRAIVNSSNFNQKFKKLLKDKKHKDIADGRFHLDTTKKVKDKVNLIISLISSQKSIVSVTYKILFWENDIKIESFFGLNFPNKEYIKIVSYKNGKRPGIIFLDEDVLDISFLKLILTNHFNFEMAKEPSENIRVQLCINLEDIIMLLDIYDDRGFDIYYCSVPTGTNL